MSQQLYTQEIGNHIRGLIWDNLAGSLSLSFVNFGDISYYMSPEDIDTIVPCVLVKPISTSTEIRTMNLNYRQIHRYRIIYVDDFSQSDDVITAKTTNTKTIADLLFDNAKLPSLSLSNNKVVTSIPVSIEFEPPEEAYLLSINSNCVASAITIETVTLSKSP